MATKSMYFASAGLAAAFILGLAAAADENKAVPGRERAEQATASHTIPPAVRATVARESRGGTVREIVPALQNGRTVYFAQYVVDDTRHAMLLAADGTILAHRSEDDGGDDD